jgi:hypothetical protein
VISEEKIHVFFFVYALNNRRRIEERRRRSRRTVNKMNIFASVKNIGFVTKFSVDLNLDNVWKRAGSKITNDTVEMRSMNTID